MTALRSSLGLTVLIGLLLGPVTGPAPAEPVAQVNGKPLDQSDLYTYMLKRDGYRSLLNLIMNEVIRQAAEKKGITVTDAEIDAAVTRNRDGLDRTAIETGTDFELVLGSQALTLSMYRENERTLLMLRKLVQDQVSVTDEQVRERYQKNQDAFKLAEAMKVSYIRFDTPQKATEVRQNIIAGHIKFEDAAKQFSTDKYTRDAGGKLKDWIQRGSTPFEEAAFGLLQDGDISDVVPFPGLGLFLIRRDTYVRNYQIDFDEVKDDVKNLMVEELTQRLAAAKQDEIMKAASVKLLLQWPEGSLIPPPDQMPGATPAPRPAGGH